MSEGMAFNHNDDLNDVVGQLEVGDKVLIENRSLPLEVIDTGSEKIGSNSHETYLVFLEGRGGRVYRLRGEYGHNSALNSKDTTPPMLEIRKEGTWESKTSCVTRLSLEDGQQIMSDTRAGDWLAEVGIDVR